MDKIKITNAVTKSIEINDSGDVIYIPISDFAFLSAYKDMITKISDLSEKMAKDTDDLASVDEKIKCAKDIVDAVDAVFGHETCKKATGAEIASPDLVAEMIDQISTLMEKWTGERIEKIKAKYANRAQRRAAKR